MEQVLRLLRGELAGKRVGLRDAMVEALARQHAQLELGDVEPAPVLRRVVRLELPQEAPRPLLALSALRAGASHRRGVVERRIEPEAGDHGEPAAYRVERAVPRSVKRKMTRYRVRSRRQR